MKVNNAGRTSIERRTPWEPPAVSKIAIGAETKSAAQDQDNPALAEPQPPSAAGHEVRVFVRDGHSDVFSYRQQE